MKKDVLIVGGNASGLQATLDLADSGIKVHLVESSPFLEKNGVSEVPKHKLNARLLEVSRHPNIRVWTNSRINHCDGEVGNFHVELRRHPRYVDLARCTACGDCMEVCPVTAPGTNHKVIYLDGQPGCMTIDKLGKPPCANTCPGGIHVQGYVALIGQGRFQEAIDLIRDAIPFPGICGRVCTHPCEINCRRAEIDKPVAIRLLKRFVSDWKLNQNSKNLKKNTIDGNQPEIDVPKIIKPNGKRVAVIGAGPGGMAVADRLARLGYQITVFEKLPVIGGMMAIGIPGYRLPRDIIAREYQHIQDLGVEIKLNTTIAPDGDHTLDDLFEMGYHAVCLAIGAHNSQSLQIHGEELSGVVHGIDVLKTINLSQQLADPKYDLDLQQILRQGENTRIAVLGGGNTAMDVSRSLKRLDVRDVRILYRRTHAEMPAMPEEIDDAEKEGIKIDFLVSPVRVLGDEQSGVIGLECIRMKLGEPDASGRRRPVPIADSEFVIDLDLVVLAIGQSPDLDFMGPDHGIAITRDKRINVAEINFMTNRPAVFAVGDAVTKDKMVVIEAIGMGKKAAAAIDSFLRGQPPAEIVVDSRDVPIARREMTEDELVIKKQILVPTIPLEQRLNSYAEVELGYTAEQAIQEAQRCLACGPCSECQACVQVCKPNAIIHNQQETFVELDIGAIIFTDDPDSKEKGGHFSHLYIPEGAGIYRIPGDDTLLGSAMATHATLDLCGTEPRVKMLDQIQVNSRTSGYKPWSIVQSSTFSDHPDRDGVFICECGDQISKFVDTDAIRTQAASWPGVIHAQVIPFSCSPEGAEIIDTAVKAHNLNRIVLAGCSCCSINQVCYSCTFQRVRCKDNLKLFTQPERSSALGTIDQAVKFVLVNIREQCAWVHTNNRQTATAKATAIVGASVARAMATPTKLSGSQPADRSVLILGNGEAAQACQLAMSGRGISVNQVKSIPDQVRRAGGKYTVTQNGHFHQASALVLAPKDSQESEDLILSFGKNEYRPRIHGAWGGLDTHRPGVYYIDHLQDVSTAGAAAAARVAAWLGRIESRPPLTSVVNSTRCRTCGTCVEICEFGAPELVEENGHPIAWATSWIDPAICNGCGTCVAHCPSGAITAGYSTDSQIEAMLSVILARSK